MWFSERFSESHLYKQTISNSYTAARVSRLAVCVQ